MLKVLWVLALVLCASAIPHELIPERFAETEVEADPNTRPSSPPAPAPAAEYGAPVSPPPAPTGPVLKPAIIAHQEVNVLKIPAIPVRVEEVQAPTQDEWVMENEANDPEIHRINMAMEAVKEDMVRYDKTQAFSLTRKAVNWCWSQRDVRACLLCMRMRRTIPLKPSQLPARFVFVFFVVPHISWRKRSNGLPMSRRSWPITRRKSHVWALMYMNFVNK